MGNDAEPSSKTPEDEQAARERVFAEHIRSVRLGHGANCSSIGSVVDTLFASAVLTGAIFAAVCAALATEKITVVGAPASKKRDPDEDGGGTNAAESDRRDV
jgi:hypothetical protein